MSAATDPDTSDLAERRRSRARGRRVVILSLALTVLGSIAIFPPLVLIGHGGTPAFGLPGSWLYLFAAWGLMIAGAGILAHRLPADDAPTERDGAE